MKYSNDTHKTRCGNPWWELPIKNDAYLYIGVHEQGHINDFIFRINKITGYAYTLVDKSPTIRNQLKSHRRCSQYDLILKVRHHCLPTELPIKAQFAHKKLNGNVCIFKTNPTINGDCSNELMRLPTWLYGNEMLADFDSTDSLHCRTISGNWKKCDE